MSNTKVYMHSLVWVMACHMLGARSLSVPVKMQIWLMFHYLKVYLKLDVNIFFCVKYDYRDDFRYQ